MDFFSLHLVDIQQRLVKLWQRKIVDMLYKYNLAQYPRAEQPILYWNPPHLQDLATVVDSFNNLVQGQIIKPTTRDSEFFRSILNLPEEDDGAEYIQILLPDQGNQGAGNPVSRPVAGDPQSNNLVRERPNYSR